jgi:hypothetical protein
VFATGALECLVVLGTVRSSSFGTTKLAGWLQCPAKSMMEMWWDDVYSGALERLLF